MEWSIVYILAILLIPYNCRADQRFNQTKPAEIVFTIDVSNVNEKVFNEVMVVVREIPNRMPMFEDGVRVGVVAFASNVEIVIELTANEKELWATKKPGDLGNLRKTDEGLKAAKKVLEKARPNVKQIVILLTDGPPSILEGDWRNDSSRRRAGDAAMVLRAYQGATIFVGLVVPYEYPTLFYGLHIAGESHRVMWFEDGRKFSDKIIPGIYDVIKCVSGSVCVTQLIKTTSIGQTTLSTTDIEDKTTESTGISKKPGGKDATPDKAEESGGSYGWAIGIIVCIVVLLIILVIVVAVVVTRKKKAAASAKEKARQEMLAMKKADEEKLARQKASLKKADEKATPTMKKPDEKKIPMVAKSPSIPGKSISLAVGVGGASHRMRVSLRDETQIKPNSSVSPSPKKSSVSKKNVAWGKK